MDVLVPDLARFRGGVVTPEQLQDFKERLEKAAHTLRWMSHDRDGEMIEARLAGKAEGVRLALSYLNEYQQGRLP